MRFQLAISIYRIQAILHTGVCTVPPCKIHSASHRLYLTGRAVCVQTQTGMNERTAVADQLMAALRRSAVSERASVSRHPYSMYCGALHLGSYIRRASQTPLFNVLPPPVCHHRKISDPQVGKLPCTCIMQYHALYGFLGVDVLCIMHVHGGIILLVE